MNVLNKLKNYLKINDIFGQNKEKVINFKINMFFIKSHIKNLIKLMDHKE